jgi:hypothetical protein
MSDFNISDAGNNPAGINKPNSGTWGEKAAQSRLEAALPGPIAPTGPGGAGAPPMPTPAAAPAGGAPAGLPPSILRPTERPDVPASTPLATPPVNPLAGAQSGRQRRLAILDAIANDPKASTQTREWAQLNIKNLIQGSTR